MTLDTMPLLRRSAKVSDHGAAIAIEYLENEITLDGKAAALFKKIQPHLDGKTTLGRIAEQTGEPPARVRALTEQLRHTGVVNYSDDGHQGQKMTTGKEFYELHRK